MKVANSKRLGDIALEEGLITPAQLDECLAAQRIIAELSCTKLIGEVMVDKKMISAEQRDKALRIQRERYQVRTLGEYELGSKLGQGGMGAVFRATRTTDKQPVALKFLSKELHGRAGYLERFDREARLASSMLHPHLVRSFGAEELGGRRVLVMEYVEGETLDRVIRTSGRLSEREALQVAWQLALALAYVHGKGIVHRDVKPNNVMIDAAGNAKLLDLGLARHAEAAGRTQITMTGQIIGTPDFMSPEQILDKPTDPRSDVYSLGATLYMMVTGQPPYAKRGDNQAILMGHLAGRLGDPREHNPDLSAATVQIIRTAMATDIAHRYPSMEALAADIDAAKTGRTLTMPAPPSASAPIAVASPAAAPVAGPSEPADANAVTRIAPPAPGSNRPAPAQQRTTSGPVPAITGKARAARKKTAHSRAVERGVLAVAAVAIGLAVGGFALDRRAGPPVVGQDAAAHPAAPGSTAPVSLSAPPVAPTPSPELPEPTYESLVTDAGGLLREGEATRALTALGAAERIRSLDGPALILRAEAYILLGQHGRARGLLQHVTERDPASSFAWHLLGEVHLRLQDHASALESFKRALAAGPPPEMADALRARVAALEPLVTPPEPPPPPVDPNAPLALPDATRAQLEALIGDWGFVEARAELDRLKDSPRHAAAVIEAAQIVDAQERAAREIYARMLLRQADAGEATRAFGVAISAMRRALQHSDDPALVQEVNGRIEQWRRDAADAISKRLEELRKLVVNGAVDTVGARLDELSADPQLSGYGPALAAMRDDLSRTEGPTPDLIKGWIAALPASPRFDKEDVPTGAACEPCKTAGWTACAGCREGLVEGECSGCAGSGQADCSRCRGTRREECKRCKGEGRRKVIETPQCPDCYGDGQIGTERRPKQCPRCQGRGTITKPVIVACDDCERVGTIECELCKGNGRRACNACKGSGRGPAPHAECSGSARVYCVSCKGTGKVPPRPALPRRATVGAALDAPSDAPRKAAPGASAKWLARRARRAGGGPSDQAVTLGLAWLAKHQDADGKWDADGFMKHDPPTSVCTGASKMTWVDPGITALALLAFLGAGHSPTQGEHQAIVAKAVAYLIQVQGPNGLVGGVRGHYMYGHAIATVALLDAYALSADPAIGTAAERAVEFLIAARNPGAAWRYAERDGDNDLSVTGWCMSALAHARAVDVDVSGVDPASREVLSWTESITDDEYGVSGYKARPPTGWQGPASSRFQNEELAVNTATTHAANHTPSAIAMMIRQASVVEAILAARGLPTQPPPQRPAHRQAVFDA